METRLSQSGESKNISSFIQRNYRDPDIESYVLAFMLRKMPLLASTVKIEWFSFGSHRAIFRILTIERVIFTRSSLRHAIAERKGKRPLLLKADKLMKLNLSSTNIRSVRMQIRQMFDLYRSRTVAESAFDLLKGCLLYTSPSPRDS